MPSRAELKALAKEQIKGNIGILFVCMLLVGLAISAVSWSGIGAILIAPPLSISMIRIYLNLTKGTKPEVPHLFSAFKDVFVQSIILNILMEIFIMLWSFLLVIPGIIKALSYSMANYILAENPEMTWQQALNESKRMMNGHKMELFILQLSFILWILLICVTFGIAGIYVGPYMSATMANYYNHLKTLEVAN